MTDVARQLVRVALRTHRQMHDPRRILRERQIHLARLRFAPSPIARVGCNSHNCEPASLRFAVPYLACRRENQFDLLADGILSGPIPAREGLVDNCDTRSPRTVGGGERASLFHCDAHRLQVPPIRDAILRRRLLVGLLIGCPSISKLQYTIQPVSGRKFTALADCTPGSAETLPRTSP